MTSMCGGEKRVRAAAAATFASLSCGNIAHPDHITSTQINAELALPPQVDVSWKWLNFFLEDDAELARIGALMRFWGGSGRRDASWSGGFC